MVNDENFVTAHGSIDFSTIQFAYVQLLCKLKGLIYAPFTSQGNFVFYIAVSLPPPSFPQTHTHTPKKKALIGLTLNCPARILAVMTNRIDMHWLADS